MSTVKSRFVIRMLSGVAAAAFLTSGGVAFADETPSGDSAADQAGGLQEIIVTARKTNEKLQDERLIHMWWSPEMSSTSSLPKTSV